jgi:hypothetical protein
MDDLRILSDRGINPEKMRGTNFEENLETVISHSAALPFRSQDAEKAKATL